MTAKQWLDSTVGKYIDADGIYKYQCVDLVKDYFPKVIGIPAIRNNAKDYWTNYPTAHFTKIANTPSFIPKRGDIMVWGTGVGTYGHIAICEGEATTNYFVSLDQNWPYSNGTTPSKYIRHNYNSVLGVLRPKKDVNFDQVAYEAELRRQAEEAARIAAEKQAEADRLAKLAEEEARAEADRIQKEQAAIEKAEQERLAKEQARLDAELKAKQEAGANTWQNILLKIIEVINKWLKGEL
jgi:hypothetical protein